MARWAAEHLIILSNYIDGHCSHLLDDLGTHPFPASSLKPTTLEVLTLLPASNSPLNLTRPHDRSAGVYMFILLNSTEPAYIGTSINFLRRLEGHLGDMDDPSRSGQERLYSYIRSLPSGLDSIL